MELAEGGERFRRRSMVRRRSTLTALESGSSFERRRVMSAGDENAPVRRSRTKAGKARAAAAPRSISLQGSEELKALTDLVVLSQRLTSKRSDENTPEHFVKVLNFNDLMEGTMFDAPDSEANVRFELDPSGTFQTLAAATPIKLIEKMTISSPDTLLVADVIAILPNFMAAHDFAVLLLLRIYWSLKIENTQQLIKDKRGILFRTLTVLATWFDTQYERDFVPRPYLMTQLHVNFKLMTTKPLFPESKSVLEHLLNALEKAMAPKQLEDESSSNNAQSPSIPRTLKRPRSVSIGQRVARSLSQTKRRSLSISGVFPSLNLGQENDDDEDSENAPPSAMTVHLLSQSSSCLADQLNETEQALFKKIRIDELMKLNWTKEEVKNEMSPNIVAIINRFNQVSQWTASEILQERNLEARTQLLEKFIRVADKSWRDRNYATALQICLGLQKQEVFRLQKTWKKIGSYEKNMWKTLLELTSPMRNWTALRTAMSQVHEGQPAASVPFTGLFLSDLVFNAELPDYSSPTLINLRKFRTHAKVLREISFFQSLPNYPEPVFPSNEKREANTVTPATIVMLRLQMLPGLPDEKLAQLSKRWE